MLEANALEHRALRRAARGCGVFEAVLRIVGHPCTLAPPDAGAYLSLGRSVHRIDPAVHSIWGGQTPVQGASRLNSLAACLSAMDHLQSLCLGVKRNAVKAVASALPCDFQAVDLGAILHRFLTTGQRLGDSLQPHSLAGESMQLLYLR